MAEDNELPIDDSSMVEAPETEPRDTADSVTEHDDDGLEQSEQGNPRETADSSDTDLLFDRLNGIEHVLTAFNDRAKSLEAMNLKMHEQVSQLRENSIIGYLQPLFESLAALHMEILEIGSYREGRDAEEMNDLAFQVEDIFGHFGIESVQAETGVSFDRALHAAIQKKNTDDEALDGTIERVRRQGFKRLGNERVLIPAQVVVHRYKPSPETTS